MELYIYCKDIIIEVYISIQKGYMAYANQIWSKNVNKYEWYIL